MEDKNEGDLYMILPEKFNSFDCFEVIPSIKPPKFVGAKVERNCILTPIDDSPKETCLNKVIDRDSQPKIGQHVHVIN